MAQNKDLYEELGVSFNRPKEFTIAGITVSNTKELDANTIIMVSGLNIGDKIKISSAK